MRVYSVDVGTNQLDWRLKNDERVVSIEEMHIKDLTSDDVENDKVDFIVIDEKYHDEAIKKIISFSGESGYELVGVEESPIKGTKGNKEFLILINFNKQNK